MITCYVKYAIDPFKIEAFEEYAKTWIPFTGKHHDYFLPHEGANNTAYVLFCFPKLVPMRSTEKKM